MQRVPFLKHKLRKIIVKPIVVFIHNAWLILALILLQLIATPPFLAWYYSFGLGAAIFESIYVFMGDPPSILYAKQADYPASILGILLALRISGWFFLPLLLG